MILPRYLHPCPAPEMQAAGIKCPSSSPADTGFISADKKSLRHCIDYWGLKVITLKIRYPLSSLSQDAKIFTKSDLRNVYHSVGIRDGNGVEDCTSPLILLHSAL